MSTMFGAVMETSSAYCVLAARFSSWEAAVPKTGVRSPALQCPIGKAGFGDTSSFEAGAIPSITRRTTPGDQHARLRYNSMSMNK